MAINDSALEVFGDGLMAQAADGTRIQAPTKWQAEDATGTTKKSPLAVADTEIDLIVPENAVWLVIKANGADLRVAIADSGTAAAPYFVVRSGDKDSFPVAAYAGSGVASVFLLRDASTSVTVDFRFEILKK